MRRASWENCFVNSATGSEGVRILGVTLSLVVVGVGIGAEVAAEAGAEGKVTDVVVVFGGTIIEGTR